MSSSPLIQGPPVQTPFLQTDQSGKLLNNVSFPWLKFFQNEVTAINAAAFFSLQDAIDALPAGGGKINVPAGVYILNESLRMPPSGLIVLQGSGTGSTGSGGTRIIASSSSVSPIVSVQGSLSARISNVFIRDLTIEGIYNPAQLGLLVDHATVVVLDNVQFVQCGQAEWINDCFRCVHNETNYFQCGSGGTNTTAMVRLENVSDPSLPTEQVFFIDCVWEGAAGGMQGTAIYFDATVEECRLLGCKIDFSGTNPTFPLLYINGSQVIDISHNTISGFNASGTPGVVYVTGSAGKRAFNIRLSDNFIAFSNTVPAILLDFAQNYAITGSFQGPGGGLAIETTTNTFGGITGPIEMASVDTPINDVSGVMTILGLPASTLKFNRLYANQGTPQLIANVTLTGWGAGASAVISGRDSAFALLITAGTGPSANPSAVINFADGAWLDGNPILVISRGEDNTPVAGQWVAITSPTQATFTFVGTPSAGLVYVANAIAVGR